MAILTGFPPSNTISPIPFEREKQVKITEVPVEGRFKHSNVKFMMLPEKHYGPRAVCYEGNKNHIPGHIYGFNNNLEVIWYEEYYPDSPSVKPLV